LVASGAPWASAILGMKTASSLGILLSVPRRGCSFGYRLRSFSSWKMVTPAHPSECRSRMGGLVNCLPLRVDHPYYLWRDGHFLRKRRPVASTHEDARGTTAHDGYPL
jgi:hypothetical protein